MLAVVASPNRPGGERRASRRSGCGRRGRPRRGGRSSAPRSGYGVVGWATIAPVGVAATEPTTIVRSRVGADAVGVARRDEQVERQQAVDAGAVGVVRRRHVAAAEAQVADDRPGLLRQAGLVEAAHDVAVEHRRRAEHLADGDHAGAADAREAHGELVGRHDGHRVGQPGAGVAGRAGRRRRAGLASVVDGHRGERRAVALQARHVEVAARLVDAGLAAVRRVDRLHRQAVALVAAVAAALADPLVDDDAEVRAWRRRPRLRSRRSSAAQRWSWSSTVTPGDRRPARPGSPSAGCGRAPRPGRRRAARSRRRPTCPGRRT